MMPVPPVWCELRRMPLPRTPVNRVQSIFDSQAVDERQGEEIESKWRSRSTPEVCLSLRYLLPLGGRSVLVGLILSLFFARRSFCLGLEPLELFRIYRDADGDLLRVAFPSCAGFYLGLGRRANRLSGAPSGPRALFVDLLLVVFGQNSHAPVGGRLGNLDFKT